MTIVPLSQAEFEFDYAFELYAMDGDLEPLRRTHVAVLGSSTPIDQDHAKAIARLTGAIVKLPTYDAAARAVQRWLVAIDEPH